MPKSKHGGNYEYDPALDAYMPSKQDQGDMLTLEDLFREKMKTGFTEAEKESILKAAREIEAGRPGK